MTLPETDRQRVGLARGVSGRLGLLLFLVAIALATAATVFGIERYPLSTGEWIGFLAVMLLAIGLELVAFTSIE